MERSRLKNAVDLVVDVSFAIASLSLAGVAVVFCINIIRNLTS